MTWTFLALASAAVPAATQVLRLPDRGAAYAISRGPTVAIRLVRAADGAAETSFLVDARTQGVQQTVQRIPGGERHTFQATFNGTPHGTVELEAELDVVGPVPAGTYDLHARVTKVPEQLAVTSLGVEFEFRDWPGDQFLLTPTWSGGEFLEPATTIPPASPIDTGVAHSMQVTAYYGADGSGLMMFARDRSATKPKHFTFRSGRNAAQENATRVSLEFYLPNTHLGGREAGTPVAIEVRPYSFDPARTSGWFTAAKTYRAWLEANALGPGGILEQGPLETRQDVPSWMRELDLFVSEQYGWFPDESKVPQPLLNLRRLKAQLDVTDMLVGLWFWEDKRSPTGRAGSWIPLRETITQVEALLTDGIRVTGYTFPGAFDVKNPFFDAIGGILHVLNDRTGRPKSLPGGIDVFGQPIEHMQMDVASPLLLDWYLILGAFHADFSSMSGFYCDLPVTVYFPDFRRPFGGELGTTELSYLGYCEIQRRMQLGAKIVGREFVTYHEAAFEWLIRCAPAGQGAIGVLGRAYPGHDRTRGVPFFQAVYSGYTLFWPADEGFGTQTLLFVPGAYGDMSKSNMSRILAEGVSWGAIPNSSEIGLAEGKLFFELDVEEPVRSAFQHHKTTLRNLIALRRRARPWLTYGEMLNSPVVRGEMVDVTVKRLLNNQFTDETFRKLAIPTTAWRARDGSIRLVAVNGGRDAATVTVNLERIGIHGQWNLVDAATQEVFRPDANRDIEIRVEPASGRLLEPVRP